MNETDLGFYEHTVLILGVDGEEKHTFVSKRELFQSYGEKQT